MFNTTTWNNIYGPKWPETLIHLYIYIYTSSQKRPGPMEGAASGSNDFWMVVLSSLNLSQQKVVMSTHHSKSG